MKAISLLADPLTGGQVGAIAFGLVVVVVDATAAFAGAALFDELPLDAK